MNALIKLLRPLAILIFLSGTMQLNAQQWHYHNPTMWFDINTLAVPGPGIVATGGGWETNNSVQIMFHTGDYGNNWYENAHDGLAPWNKSIAFSDSLNGYGVGYDGRIIRSDDAGRNWGWATYPTSRDLNKIFYAGYGTYYVVGGHKSNDSIQTILKTNDYGVNWNVICDTFGHWLKSVFFFDTLRGFAIGDNGVILSTVNGGMDWATVAAPLQRDFNAITFIDANTGYIVGGLPDTACRRTILRTTNGGVTWNVLTDVAGGMLKDISFADTQVGYAAGDSATVLKTIDGGVNWFEITIDSSLSDSASFNAVKFYDRTFGAVGGKAGVLYLYIDLPVEVFTMGISQLGTTAATLHGAINTHTKNARYSFVYSNSMTFAVADTTPGVDVQNDSILLISHNLQGLTPDTSYYFYLRAVTESDTIYSDTLSFFTGISPDFIFLTGDATGISGWGANLNGFVDKCPEPVNLYFEYGATPAFGSQIAANPASVNDTLWHAIQAHVSPLQPQQTYFFRLKGVSGTGTYFGNTKTFNATDMPWASTGNAMDVTLISARLNGNISNNGPPAAIKFEYGLSVQYGTEVDATPDSVSGMNNVYAEYQLTGLTPFTTYHYRIKAINTDGVSYGNNMIFITGGPTVNTHMPTSVCATSAQLNGFANANGLPAACFFEYGPTAGYGNEVAAIPDSVFGSSTTNIKYGISGLLPNTGYHFRAKATGALGTVYGNDIMFSTGAPPSVFTEPATEIDQHSARLNGKVDANGIPAAIRFEYGTTSSYGSEVSAVPDTVSSTGLTDVYANVTGLTPNTTYHYRIKGIGDTLTNTGSDMMFFTGYPSIPNFDFELWTEHIKCTPEGFDFSFGRVTQSSDACHNNYAVKIMNDTSSNDGPGAVLIGNTLDEGHTFVGGVPFNARPDSILGCFKYDIVPGDSALVLLKLKTQGITISEKWYPIFGSSSGSFEELKFPVSYTAAGNADSIIIGFVATDVRNMSQVSPLNYLIVDNIRFSGTTENIPNNDFENWDTSAAYVLNNWFYSGMNGTNPGNPCSPLTRTTDAQHADYAVLLQNCVSPADTNSGYLATGNNWNSPDFAVNSRHKYFTGYYKSFPENNDTIVIYVTLFKNHNQVAWGYFETTSTVSDYTPFLSEIQYFNNNDSIIPDSGRISAQTCRMRPMGNSKLYLDNLNFDGFLSGVKEQAITDAGNMEFNVYPNPFRGQATLWFSLTKDEKVTICLYDLSGKQVAMPASGPYAAGEHHVSLSASGLQKGFYICVIQTQREVRSKKLIIY